MPLTSGNFADLLKPGLKNIFDVGMSRPRPIMELLFGVETSTRFEEQYQGRVSFPRLTGRFPTMISTPVIVLISVTTNSPWGFR